MTVEEADVEVDEGTQVECPNCGDKYEEDEGFTCSYCGAGACGQGCVDGCDECDRCDACCNCVFCENCDNKFARYDGYVSAGGDDVCESCWYSYYCSDCECHQDYCCCDQDDHYSTLPDKFVNDPDRYFQYKEVPKAWADWAPAATPYKEWYINMDGYTTERIDKVLREWGFNPSEHDPAAAMATFYLTEAIMAGVLSGGHPQVSRDPELVLLADEARQIQEQLIEEFDQVFLRYAQMVCWGELRYHPALFVNGNGRPYDPGRTTTWLVAAKYTRNAPPEAWTDIANMFRDIQRACNGDTNVGGESWATIAEVIQLRLMNKLSPKLWCDRVFNLQHNGGSLLNKVVWKNSEHIVSNHSSIEYMGMPGIDRLMTCIGVAHSQAQPWLGFLAQAAGMTSLLRRAVRVANKARHAWNQPLIQPDDGMLHGLDRSPFPYMMYGSAIRAQRELERPGPRDARFAVDSFGTCDEHRITKSLIQYQQEWLANKDYNLKMHEEQKKVLAKYDQKYSFVDAAIETKVQEHQANFEKFIWVKTGGEIAEGIATITAKFDFGDGLIVHPPKFIDEDVQYPVIPVEPIDKLELGAALDVITGVTLEPESGDVVLHEQEETR